MICINGILYSRAFITAAYKFIELFKIANDTFLYFDSKVGELGKNGTYSYNDDSLADFMYMYTFLA